MIIPLEQLSTETLNAIIENFVLREGTEYGSEDVSLSDKITQVRQQLTQGSALLVYSELHETVNILPTDQLVEDSDESA
ncbi:MULTISPECIES: YheU family protein [unclassified Colwellia]|uniref:YheU family protein n=1 Tax=unclassified Colwellia TaxID=196834 RepID=UPI0015F3C9AF|nr:MULTISPECIES: YheU family protein [unclassified Colwellia]MBA6223467.1 YheU family protein [Colwellia sp. MB3u-45]MBA6267992.1 YheU family protein [Colwellia sp. MB3u-43]MBA6287799.1 YheU family protein [Colwellia sp. MB3u-4]MBA6295293.1 YheU family protein [Colwellia sp. MB02u-9]MBA6321651.1 YheU family protein [Colwellia sp. MB02u-19]